MTGGERKPTHTADSEARLLAGLSIVEIGGGIAGASAGAVLAQLGASVRAFHWPCEAARADGNGPDAIARALLDEDKVVAPLTDVVLLRSIELLRAVRGADVVILDAISRPPGLDLDWLLADVGRVRIAGVVDAWVTITAFGLTGPYRHHVGSELICSAAGGALATVCSVGTGRPMKLAGRQALISAGQLSALAGLHALDLARTRGRPVHLDLSAQEAVATTSARLELSIEQLRSKRGGGSGRAGPPSGVYPCKDGFVHINALENHQWRGVLAAMGNPAWGTGEETGVERKLMATLIDERVSEWTAPQGKHECAERLQGLGVPSAPLNDARDLVSSEQYWARGFLERREQASAGIVAPRSPLRPHLVEAPSQTRTTSTRRAAGSLTNLRVLEFGHVIAAPFASSLLGAMGADVVRVETRRRMDIYRRSEPYADDVAGANRGCYFTFNNFNKRSILIPDEPDPASLTDLIDEADVVIENLGGRAARLHVDARSVSARHPAVFAVSISGYGSGGPVSSYRAYAYNIHAYAGLLDATRDEQGEIAQVQTAWADFCTSVATATVVAARSIGPHARQGGYCDVSMAESATARLTDYIVVGQLDGSSVLRGSDEFGVAPNNVYRTSDHRWLTISVDTAQRWADLRIALGDPAVLASPRFDSAEGRWARRRELDVVLAECVGAVVADELHARLQGRGVPACPVWDATALATDQHIAARGYLCPVSSPDLGAYRLPGLPWTVVGEGRIGVRPAPPFPQTTVTESLRWPEHRSSRDQS